MSDDNLKFKVKSELKNYIPNKLLLELFKEMNLNTSLGKNDAIDSIFQSYTAEEVKDRILKKYDEKGSYSRSKERFLKSINRKSIEERSKLKKKEEKERKRKNKEKKKKEKEPEERKLKEKELEEERRPIEKERVEEAKRRQEQNRKIEEEKKREEERRQEIQRKKEEEKRIKIEKNRKTEQEKREVNKRMKELLQNSSSNLKIYHAKCTDVFFIYDYIKSKVRKDYKKNNIRLSSKMDEIVKIDGKIIGYKDGFHIEFFSEKLLESIKIISAVYFRDKDGVVLVAVPPSEKGKDPQTKKSIEMIEEWANEGKYEIDFKVYDKSKFLIRTHDVESSKTGNRSIAKHENSIECDKKDNMPSNIGVIILDDVTTSGNTMYVCKNKLIEYGLDEENVIPLAIARTLNPYNEIYDSLEGKYFVYDDNVEELK